MKSARAYIAKNDNQAAVIQLKNALGKAPESAEGRYLLGQVLLDSGDAASAIVELRRAVEYRHPAAQVVPALARALVADRQYQKVIESFENVKFTESAALADLKTSMASANAALGNIDRAHDELRLALKAVPEYPPAMILEARFAADERKSDEALALISKVISTTPSDPMAWHYKGDFLLYLKSDLSGAEAAYRKALSIKPSLAVSRSSLIAVLLAQRNLSGAEEQIRELRKTLPGNPQAVFFEAQHAFLSQNFKKARQLIQQVLKVAPDNVKALQLSGTIDYSYGSLLEAERSLNRALLLSTNMSGARRTLAQTYLRMGQPLKALTALQPVLAQSETDPQTYSLAAEAYLQAGDLGQAEANFAKAANLDPADTRSRTALALTKLKLSDVEPTAVELQNLASADRGIYADLALVSIYIRSGNLARALKSVDSIEKKQPEKPMAPNMRGQIQVMQKDAAGARRSFERALAIDPVYVPAVVSLAALDLSDKKPEAAKKRFNAVLAIDPTNLTALIALATLRAREGGTAEEVATLLNTAIKLNPTEQRPRILLIDHYLRNKDYKLALTAAQDASAALPRTIELLDSIGRAQMGAGETNQAITTFNALAEIDAKSPQAYIRLAGVHLAAKNVEAAEQSLRRALAIVPNFLAAQQTLIEIALGDNRPQDALMIARTVQKQRPKEIVGFMMEGAIEVSRKNYPAAINVYRAAARKFPTAEPAMKLHAVLVTSGQMSEAEKMAASWAAEHPQDIEFTLYVGEMAMARQDFASAEKYFRMVLGVRPESVEALNNLAWTLVQLQAPGALAYAEKADMLRPNTPVLMDTLATVLAAEKQVDRAIEVQKKALALAPANAQLRMSLAKLYLRLGDKSAARTELEALAKLGDKFTGQAQVTQLLKSM